MLRIYFFLRDFNLLGFYILVIVVFIMHSFPVVSINTYIIVTYFKLSISLHILGGLKSVKPSIESGKTAVLEN